MYSNRWSAALALVALLSLAGCTKQECKADSDCNDGNACTADACVDLACEAAPVALDDGNACTADACDPATGVAHTAVSVDDGNACTADACSPSEGVTHTAVSTDDGNVCTADSCDPVAGVRHDAVSVDDGNACTADSCDPATGVQHLEVAVDDGNACTADSCDPGTGVQHTALALDDGNACTVDACESATGVTHTPVNPDDGNACTADGCDPATGVSHTATDPDDGNACTSDSCDAVFGDLHQPVATDDSNACTADSCDPQTGVGHTPVVVDDSNACTEDACDAATGVSHTPVALDDSNACTADACTPEGGVSHTPVNPDDGNVCTTDACDPATGVSHTSVTVDDGNACTEDACDPSTGVQHTPVVPDDGVACTVDSCDPVTGAVHMPDNSRCGALQVCRTTGCDSPSSSDQAGQIVITELSALGSEFIELHNTTGMDLDIHAYVFQNGAGALADLRAKNDVNGTAGTPVILPAGGYAYGVANPVSGIVPASAAFVYGDIGTTFALGDGGDAIALHSTNGAALEDFVDFRSFITDPTVKMTASAFPGFAGVSTQVDPSLSSAAGNDSGASWCTSFYGSVSGVRVQNTAGLPNGSCRNTAVINEVLIDPAGTDDSKTFLELVGPAGAQVGGWKIHDIEGLGATAGALNTDGDLASGEADGTVVLPAGWRIPADGILLVADATTAGATLVPNVSTADILIRDIDLENGGGDAIQLTSGDASAVLIDVVGHNTNGAALAVSNAAPSVNGLPLTEGATAAYPPSGATLARDAASTDTGDNRSDFHGDPSPTPGALNDSIVMGATSLAPNNGLATAATTGVVISGTDFASGITAKFGSNPPSSCTLQSATQVTCTAPVNAGGAARVDVVLTNPASVGGSVTLSNAFTYTGVLNGSANPLQADYCNLQFPSSFSVFASTETPIVYGQLYEAGLTEAAGAPAGGMAQLGYGPSTSNPTSVTTWRYFDASYNVQIGNSDEYQGSFIAPATLGTYSYTYRFSFDNGLNWTYCDLNGAGSNAGLTFEVAQLGVMTVN